MPARCVMQGRRSIRPHPLSCAIFRLPVIPDFYCLRYGSEQLSTSVVGSCDHCGRVIQTGS
jgi:hypothetical protein